MSNTKDKTIRELNLKVGILENRVDELVLVLNAFEPYMDILNELLEEKKRDEMMFAYKMAESEANQRAIFKAKNSITPFV